jgi:hypothetical protein
MQSTVWMMPPFGKGEPKEVEATPEILVPLLVKGWYQCAPPAAAKQEVTENVGH